MATEIAPALAEYFHARLKIALVLGPDIAENKKTERIDQVKQIIAENSPSAELKIILEKDIYRAIMAQAIGVDLVLMGGRTGDLIELLLGKSLSQAITENVKGPVIWVKEYEDSGSFWASRSMLRALRRENVPRPTLVARFSKAMLLFLFSTMSLIELNIAREIVLIGFATIIITLGVLTVVITVIGGKEFVRKIQESLDED
nr:hypothetical protein [candidate division Zixibacteria bacterium]